MTKLEDTKAILVVDSDDTIRPLIGNYLEILGFRTFCIGRPDQAVHTLAQHPEIALALIDIVPPGAGVMSAAKRLLDIKSIPLLFMTPYLEPDIGVNIVRQEAEQLSHHQIVTKPFLPRNLRDEILKMLEGHP